MKGKIIFILISSVLMLLCFAHSRSEGTKYKNENLVPEQSGKVGSNRSFGALHFADSNLVILKNEKVTFRPFPKAKSVELTSAEIKQIEQLVNACIANYNHEQQLDFTVDKRTGDTLMRGDFIYLNGYKTQLVAITNSQGEKIVWVNCFCEVPGWGGKDLVYWKKDIVNVMDGGNCYFNLKVNLTKGKYYALGVNGVA